MPNIQDAVKIAVDIANNNTHGYSQARRHSGIDYDCSSLVLYSLKSIGINVGSATYTGDMVKPLLNNGFINVIDSVNIVIGSGLQAGDILVKPKTNTKSGHTAFYIGNGKIVQANADYDKKLGDSSGRELIIQNYYNSGWKYVLRYTKNDSTHFDDSMNEPLLFVIKLKQDMNIRYGAGTNNPVVKTALLSKTPPLGISEVSADGLWGRIQNQPHAWICISQKYVSRI